jgi:DNA polymerase-3 subunit epsilon
MTNGNEYMELHRPWTEYTFVAFDTETSGAYPIGCEIIEFGAVKWKAGEEVATFQTLLKPRERLTDFNVSIHGITNDMVADAPLMKDKIHEIHAFLGDAVPLAHHAPFDLGFVAMDFEKHALPFPEAPVLCSSLLARKWIHGTENHKLQTLVKHLKIDGGSAHRALDDARSCLKVMLECFRLMGPEKTLNQVIKSQGKHLAWQDFSLLSISSPVVKTLIEATEQKKDVDIVYQKSAGAGESRIVAPLGIVRNPDGDYLQAICRRENVSKRYYLSKIQAAAIRA